MKIATAIVLGLTLLPTAVKAAEIYIWSDQEGVRHFSDQPPTGNERNQVKGQVQSTSQTSQQVNVIQPYVAPVADPPESPENAADSDQTGTTGNSDGPATGSDSGSDTKTALSPQRDKQNSGRDTKDKSGNDSRNGNKDELRSRSDQLRDYDRQARIKEIKDKQKAPGLNPGDKPDTLNKKLKDYNNSKQQ